MNTNKNTANNLFSRGMLAVLISQFLTALGDNALLFAAIALLKSNSAPDWQIPMLQECFVIAFILLAPFVGTIADQWPKGRVMLFANCCKFLGVSSIFLKLNPLLAYNLVGVGAAAYSPAKYGILSQLVNQDKLVKANSMIEGSTIVAILLGTVLGGMLADWSIYGALTSVAIVYLLAIVANLLIPKMPPEHAMARISLRALIKDFFRALSTLFKNPDARFSLIGTSIFWGTGSTLRFLLVAWVPVALHIMKNSTPADLSGVVAIGIAIGAAAAARFVDLKTVHRAIPAGLLIGLLIIVFAHVTNLYATVAMLVLIGACGGFYVVPLNALLQERGHETVGAGHAIAVQNFFENMSMLIMVGIYVMMDKSGVNVVSSAMGFGVLVFISIIVLGLVRRLKLQVA